MWSFLKSGFCCIKNWRHYSVLCAVGVCDVVTRLEIQRASVVRAHVLLSGLQRSLWRYSAGLGLFIQIILSRHNSSEIFIEPGVKINGRYYRDVLLAQHLLPAITELSGEFFIFQQDSAPAHRAYDTVEMLRRETPAFIAPSVWPPNSPDLNPVDYKIWRVMQDRVYRTRIRDVGHPKQSLIEERRQFDQSIIDGAVNQWRDRLRACVKARGGHFEQTL